MRIACAAIVTFLALVNFTSAGGQDKKLDESKKLVGVWQIVHDDKLPVVTLKLTGDGKAIVIAKFKDKTDRLECTYKVNGKKLTTTLKRADNEVIDTMTIEALTDTQLILDEKGRKTKFKKVKDK